MQPVNFNYTYAPLKINESGKKSRQDQHIKIIKKNNVTTSILFCLIWLNKESHPGSLPEELLFEILNFKMACHAQDLAKRVVQFEKKAYQVYLPRDRFGLMYDYHETLPIEYELHPTTFMICPCQIL